MTGDKKKENRWAKVLDDAGLLDDVDDAWELPAGDSLSNGATIEVRSSMSASPVSIETKLSDSQRRVSRDDETQKVITVLSADSSGKDEDATVRVSYANRKGRRDEESFEERASKMPLSPVRRSEEPRYMPTEPVHRIDTNPGQFAKHSLGATAEDETQPKYAVPTDDELNWDSLMDDERPTVEVPSYSQRPVSRPMDAYESEQFEFDDESLDRDVPSATETMRHTPSLVDAVSRMQNTAEEGEQDRFINVRGARLSVQAGNVNQPLAADAGSIVDNPVSEAPEPIELGPPSLRVQLTEKYEMGDFSGALELAEQILEEDPDNIDAAQYRKSCRDRLLKMYESRIGDVERVPKLLVSDHELMWRNLDASAGFILSRIDGISTYDDIIDISGMPRFETCRILERLLQDGLIE